MNLLLAAVVLGVSALDGVESQFIKPSDTDPKITEFDDPHQILFDKDVKSNGQLVLFFPGTGGKPGRQNKFLDVAVKEGFQAINLMYPTSIPATVVSRSTDKEAFLNFRLEIIEGKDLSDAISVDRTNSIENRLIKLLRHLEKVRPGEGWERYLNSDDTIVWDRIVVSGLSQGAGHAGVLAVRHKVARAVMFGGPKDFDRVRNAPAAWLALAPATSPSLMFSFNHKQDKQGGDYDEQVLNCQVLGMLRDSPICDVDTQPAPFLNSRALFTNYPGTPISSGQAHTSVVADGSTPAAADGSPLFKPVWIYMLTH